MYEYIKCKTSTLVNNRSTQRSTDHASVSLVLIIGPLKHESEQ